MNLSEFKAWFEGFTENLDGPPNTKQWKRITKRVEEITSDATPWPIFVDRYIRPYPQITWTVGSPTTLTGGTCGDVTSNALTLQAEGQLFNANDAFAQLGRNDAQNIQ